MYNAHLILADSIMTNLNNADLRGALMITANLEGANLNRADLNKANLAEAYLRGANLVEANLTEAYLPETNLRGANLVGANLDFAICGQTHFSNTNLSQTKNLETIRHQSYSYLHSTTLKQSSLLPIEFLRGCGLRDWEIEMAKLYQKDLSEEDVHQIGYEVIRLKSNIRPIEYHNCFISYSHQDESFAESYITDYKATVYVAGTHQKI